MPEGLALAARHGDGAMEDTFHIAHILLDGLLLRCPRCEMGRMFRSGFKMYHACPVCALEFERASGEVTGGMGINTVATCVVEWALRSSDLRPN